jgi:hypothetical protein
MNGHLACWASRAALAALPGVYALRRRSYPGLYGVLQNSADTPERLATEVAPEGPRDAAHAPPRSPPARTAERAPTEHPVGSGL